MPSLPEGPRATGFRGQAVQRGPGRPASAAKPSRGALGDRLPRPSHPEGPRATGFRGQAIQRGPGRPASAAKPSRGNPGDRLPRPSRPEGPPGAVSWAGLLGWLQAEQRASNVGTSSRSCFPYLPGDRGTCGYLRPRAGAPARWKARSQSC